MYRWTNQLFIVTLLLKLKNVMEIRNSTFIKEQNTKLHRQGGELQEEEKFKVNRKIFFSMKISLLYKIPYLLVIVKIKSINCYNWDQSKIIRIIKIINLKIDLDHLKSDNRMA